MPFMVSAGVSVIEIDLTTIVPAVATTQGAIAGDFRWGECNVRRLVDGEASLITNFWKPNNRVADDWFTAWNFLAYGNQLYVVRVVDQDNANTSLRATNATSANTSGFLVLNDDVYNESYSNGQLNSLYGCGEWIAKYPGALGNTLKISVCETPSAYSKTLSGTVTISANSLSVTGANTSFVSECSVGDLLIVNGEAHPIAAIASNTGLTLRTRHVQGATAGSTARCDWEYATECDLAPGTSNYAKEFGARDDEVHIVVVDSLGMFTGSNNTVLEVYQNLSKAEDSKYEDGSTAYYKDVINAKSKYVRWAGHDPLMLQAGKSITGDSVTSFGGRDTARVSRLVGGSDGTTIGNDERLRGYDLFADPEQVDISLILGSAANQTVAVHLINNVAEKRHDCIALLSPPRYTVVNNVGNEADDIIAFRNTLPSTSYAVLDSGWKYQYDKFNDVYRYTPLNGDIAGLCVRTDSTRDPWWPPAGFNRGQIKNCIKLAYNPRQADRDQLYKNGINPVVTFPGQGTVLYGDKTLLSKPSAFDRINVRRLFIVLEKAIATAAKFTLFEFNDEFTRSSFKNMVEPFLRDVMSRRGIYDFRVVCDSTNNTPERIDRNEFIADIYIKPARSINFITLNFVAVRSGVAFEEVVGKW